MPIYQTAHYRVEPSGIADVRAAIDEFVRYVKDNEPGTQLYAAWQEKSDPSSFVHLFIFADLSAQQAHSESAAVRQFEAVYGPNLRGPVEFTDYEQVATNT